MRNRAFLIVALLGLLTLALAPGYAAAAGLNLSEMLSSSVAVTAAAASPIAQATPLSMSFGVVNVNTTSAAQQLTIKNIGLANLLLSAISSSDPAFTTTYPGGIVTLVPNASAIYNVTFHPLDGATHNGTLTVVSNAANGSVPVSVSGQGNRAPTLNPIGNKTVDAFTTLAFTVTGTDADDTFDDQLTFTMGSGLPPGPTFTPGGEFSWTPTEADGSPPPGTTYNVQFCVLDGGTPALSDCETISITVVVTNHPPVANAGGSYTGTVNVPIQFNGSATDPDASQTLTATWTFGDGGTATGFTPTHPYGVAGNYLATLDVCDDGVPQQCDGDVAPVAILSLIPVQVILKNNSSSIHATGSTGGGGNLQVGIEESTRPLTGIDISSIRLTYMGASISLAADTKGSGIGDMDKDGVPDLDVYFRNISNLFTTSGTATIVVTGIFTIPGGGIPFRGEKVVSVKVGGGHGAAAISSSAYPNPFNPETVINYTTRTSGPLTMKIYSIEGRLVRTLKDGEYTEAGTYEVRWNGIDNSGRHVPSGVYFVKTSVLGENSVFKLAVTK
jgi:PKD domain/FlgD Ig-like domain